LTLRDGDGGRLLVQCWGGCDRLAVLAELRRIGLLDRRGSDFCRLIAAHRRDAAASDALRTTRALAIWREARPLSGTVAEAYLRSRRISFDKWLASLRFHPRCPHPSRARLPAMVALVEHAERGPVAIHRTFLRADGSGKANIEREKASLGPVGGGSVRLGTPRSGEWLAVGEGIETTLAVATACGMPAWAALSASGMRTILLPSDAKMILLCADNDANGVGQRAASEAAERFLSEGRRIRIAVPPRADTDFNDLLTDGSASTTRGAHDVAA
jgi:hypothetical protein